MNVTSPKFSGTLLLARPDNAMPTYAEIKDLRQNAHGPIQVKSTFAGPNEEAVLIVASPTEEQDGDHYLRGFASNWGFTSAYTPETVDPEDSSKIGPLLQAFGQLLGLTRK